LAIQPWVADPTYEAGTERSHVAHLIKHAEEAAAFGVTFKPRIDIVERCDWKKSVAGRRRGGVKTLAGKPSHQERENGRENAPFGTAFQGCGARCGAITKPLLAF
jgi:hypothetical protein